VEARPGVRHLRVIGIGSDNHELAPHRKRACLMDSDDQYAHRVSVGGAKVYLIPAVLFVS
jgi:hypothetical protein